MVLTQVDNRVRHEFIPLLLSPVGRREHVSYLRARVRAMEYRLQPASDASSLAPRVCALSSLPSCTYKRWIEVHRTPRSGGQGSRFRTFAPYARGYIA